jgi:tetratricopeptide (TPR) repeat protein
MLMKRIAGILLVLLPFFALAERPLNELPMYGGEYEAQVEENPDLSRDAAKRGWEAYYRNDLDTAIRRFNQAWMYDRENPEVYWGFGLVIGQRALVEKPKVNLEESIRLLQMASARDQKNGRILGDLAYPYTLLGYYREVDGLNAEEAFEKARALFPQAYELDSKYPPIVANWSVFYFYTRDYEAARKKATQAMEMGYRFDPAYLDELESSIK